MSRPDVEPMVREIWERTPNGCGHRQARMCLVHEFGTRISAKTVLRVMRRMGLRCAIRSRNPWRRYSSYRGETGDRVHNLPERDFDAARPFSRLGTDVTEFKVAGSKAYLAPVYDMASKEIVAWDVSRSPDSGSRSACPPCSRSACPPARSRSCTRTWDGSTSTNGGGRSSNAPASAGP